ncbi:MAG TPA: hypothetical protein VIH24_06035 [Candidatus Limnocylindria bacterium]|jgi:hypothetical protein
MSHLGRAAARLVLRLHPAGWRVRYGPEVLDLIGDTDSSLADATDLARSAIREHLKGGTPMRFEFAYRRPGAFAGLAALLVAPTLAIVGVSLLGHELGIAAIAAAADPIVAWIDMVGPVDLFVVAAPLAAFLLAVLPLLDLRVERLDGAPAVSMRIRALTANLIVGGIALLVGAVLVAYAITESVG